MPLIALTGGIASGKSTIAERLAEQGAVVVDADKIVREVQAMGSPVLVEISKKFGPDILHDDGSLDRAALGARVFDDTRARAALNSIVHPAVRAESHRLFRAAFARDPQAVVVYDVPLLVESRADEDWDLVVVAECPAPQRRDRLVQFRGMDPVHAQARIDAQASDAQRRALADAVIDTSGSLAHTHQQVDALWMQIASERPS